MSIVSNIKYVRISNLPVDKDSNVDGVSDAIKFFGSDQFVSNNRYFSVLSGMQNKFVSVYLSILIGQFKTFGDWICEGVDCDRISDYLGWRIPVVVEFQPHPRKLSFSELSNFGRYNRDVSPQLPSSRIFHYFDGVLGGVGSALSGGSKVFSVLSPSPHESELYPKHAYLNTSNDEKTKGEQGQHPRPKDQAPFVRRFFIALNCLLCSALGGFFGVQAFYDKRVLIRSLWILGGFLVGLSGIVLGYLTIYTWSWDWWL